MGCKSSFDQQVSKERKCIKRRFSQTVKVNIMLFGYKNQGKTTLAKYYLQEQEQEGPQAKYGSFKIEDSTNQSIMKPDDGLRFLEDQYQHTEGCQLGLKLMNLSEVIHPVALRIFDTPGIDKGDEFFIPGERVLFRNIDWALLVINPDNTIIKEETVIKFRRYVEQAELRALDSAGKIKFRLVVFLQNESKIDLILQEELNKLMENQVIEKWSMVTLDRSHRLDPLLIEIVKQKVEEQKAWNRNEGLKFQLTSLSSPKLR